MAVDIERELQIINGSKDGSEIKDAIIDALYAISLAGTGELRPYDIDLATDFGFGVEGECLIGVATEQEVN